MKKPAIPKLFAAHSSAVHSHERGVTMVLVAVAMLSIIGMAALSIDVVTLYLDREEAQRSADAAALAAARVLSVSGITGDPSNSTGNWGQICGPGGMATLAAQAVVGQNTVSSAVPGTINVSYSAGSGGSITSNADCQTLAATAFGVNPLVTVKVTRAGLPTFFSRIWGNTANSVSATATAEAFNPSNSGNTSNQNSGSGAPLTPVQPMCVKPWVVPNQDPLYPVVSGGGFCGPGTGTPCQPFVNTTTGQIMHPGISTGGPIANGVNGVIGETFWLVADCRFNQGGCNLRSKTSLTGSGVQPQANFSNGFGNIQQPPNLLYVPNQVGTTVQAIPTCTDGDSYSNAIVGCDQATNYSCGVQNANTVDLTINPDIETSNAVQCLTHQNTSGDVNNPTGQDYLNYGTYPFTYPGSYPFQILAGSSSPLVGAGLTAGTPITSSPSIVSLPIYDDTQVTTLAPNTLASVTFVGFLQVFINAVDGKGNVNVTVLNVAGCSNGGGSVGTPIPGTSPVPVRLITPP